MTARIVVVLDHEFKILGQAGMAESSISAVTKATEKGLIPETTAEGNIEERRFGSQDCWVITLLEASVKQQNPFLGKMRNGTADSKDWRIVYD